MADYFVAVIYLYKQEIAYEKDCPPMAIAERLESCEKFNAV
jgi:hypothetical protein